MTPQDAPAEVSTRRITKSGTVHEMAAFGVRSLCGRDLPEPWEWTEEPVSCKQCLAKEASDA